MRNEKGVTLMALVITIIIMLTVAGISISVVIGENSVTAKAEQARALNNVSAIEELISSQLITEKTVEEEFEILISNGYMKKIIDSSNKEIYWITKSGIEKLAPGYEKEAEDEIINERILNGQIVENGDTLKINDISDLNSTNIYVINKELKVTYITDRIYGDLAFETINDDSSEIWWKEKVEVSEEIDTSVTYSDDDIFIYDDPSNPGVIVGFDASITEFNEDLVIPAERELKDKSGIVVEKIRVTEIKKDAFNKDINLNLNINGNVIIKNGIKIGENAFKGQANIKKVDLECASLGTSAFENCTSIENIKIIGPKIISKNAFKNAITDKTYGIKIGDTVTIIEESAFEGYGGVSQIYFSNNLERIEKGAFKNLAVSYGIERIDLSQCQYLNYIGEDAFLGNHKITQISLPNLEMRKNNSLTLDSNAFNLNFDGAGELTAIDMVLDTKIKYKSNTFSSNINITGGVEE